MTSFLDVFTQHLGTSYARQLALADLVGDRPWSADLDAGTISFGDEFVFQAQFLGSRSNIDDTWLWGWGNHHGYAPAVLEASIKIQAFGEVQDISELMDRKFKLGPITDHMVAMACRGILDGDCYYRAPYDDGAAFLLLAGLPPEVTQPVAQERVSPLLIEILSSFHVNHRLLAESFLAEQGFVIDTREDGAEATRGNTRFIMTFDHLDRITSIEGKLVPHP
ncbi:MAG TPA: hypothetical protein VL574_07375 [Stellaceae bacterium]|jgi:hypothetical protein|nr:hypothetical protein [Stellaceae bacterium]